MNLKTNALTMAVKFITCALLALGAVAQAQEKNVDPTGTWTWSMAGRNGQPDRKMSVKLKLEAGKLVGAVVMPARQEGQEPRENPISEGKIKGNEISFAVVIERNGNKMTTKYSGKITGDTLKGTIESVRNEKTNSREWEAKKEAAKK